MPRHHRQDPKATDCYLTKLDIFVTNLLEMGGDMIDRLTICSSTAEDIDHVVGMRLRLQGCLLASNSNVWQMSPKRISGLPFIL